MGLPMIVQHGAIANNVPADAKFCSASREDFAEATAKVLRADYKGKNEVLELAGDEPYTLQDLARIIADASGKPVTTVRNSTAEYTSALQSFGVPKYGSEILADANECIGRGLLAENGAKTLSKLLGRKTTPVAETVKAALAA